MPETDIHVVAATEKHTHTIIFLHGRESTAKDFASEIFESQASDGKTLPEALPHFKWVFPNSGELPVSRFDDMASQWFNIWDLKDPEEHNETQKDGIEHNVFRIIRIISQETKHVDSSRIYLAGISQGCAIGIHTLLRNPYGLAGFIGLSSWLPFREQIEQICKTIPDPTTRLESIQAVVYPERTMAYTNCLKAHVFLAHCKDDDVVHHAQGVALRDTLVKLGMLVEWHSYEDGGHWLNEPQGVDDMLAFLGR